MEMGSARRLFFLSHILTHFLVLSIAQPDFITHYCNFFSYDGNYTAEGTYRKNLDAIPMSLSSNASITDGFYNLSVGQNPDMVNAIGLCRGDVEPNLCRSCLNDSNAKLRQICPNQKVAIGWYDNCMFRYSNRSILHTVETLPNAYAYNLNNASNVVQFNQVVRSLLDSLRVEAARGGSTRKFAIGDATGPDNLTIYALAQCTPDLSLQQCNECLNGTAEVLPICCDGRLGGKVLRPSCNFRYEIGRFYNGTPTHMPPPVVATSPDNAPTSANAPSPQGNGGNMKATTVALVTGSTLMAAVIAILVL